MEQFGLGLSLSSLRSNAVNFTPVHLFGKKACFIPIRRVFVLVRLLESPINDQPIANQSPLDRHSIANQPSLNRLPIDRSPTNRHSIDGHSAERRRWAVGFPGGACAGESRVRRHAEHLPEVSRPPTRRRSPNADDHRKCTLYPFNDEWTWNTHRAASYYHKSIYRQQNHHHNHHN